MSLQLFALLPLLAQQAPLPVDPLPSLQPYAGVYTLAEEDRGRLFPEFAKFAVTTVDEGRHLQGHVVGPTDRTFASISILQGRLRFTTLRVDGISYSFVGDFLVIPPSKADDGKTVVLEGTLKRIRNGVMSASAKLKFCFVPDRS